MPAWPLILALVSAASGPVDPALAAAERAFSSHDYERVIPLTQKALSHNGPREEKIRAYEIQALAYTAFDDSRHAISAFESLLRLDPSWEPTTTSPKVLGLVEEARQKVPRPVVKPIVISVEKTVAEKPVPLTQRWWFWTAVGVVVVGGAATTAVLTQSPTPHGNLPNGTLK